jgi:hypothetical protein
VAAAAPTTKDSSSCPFALRQWLAVGCGGASCCQVRCQRVSSRLIVLLLQCMYIHDVPRSLCTVGRWERTCEDWNKEAATAASPANLDVHTVDPACFLRPAYRKRVPVQGTTVQSCRACNPSCHALHLLLLAFRARYTTGPTGRTLAAKATSSHASSILL